MCPSGVLPAAFEAMPLVQTMKRHTIWPAGTVAAGRLYSNNNHSVIQLQPQPDFRRHSKTQVYIIRSMKLAKDMLGSAASKLFTSTRSLGALSNVEAPLIIKYNANSEALDLTFKLKATLEGSEIKQRRGFGGKVINQ